MSTTCNSATGLLDLELKHLFHLQRCTTGVQARCEIVIQTSKHLPVQNQQ